MGCSDRDRRTHQLPIAVEHEEPRRIEKDDEIGPGV
jgi:hypothetical protein